MHHLSEDTIFINLNGVVTNKNSKTIDHNVRQKLKKIKSHSIRENRIREFLHKIQ